MICLSNRQAKEADRVGGIALILPWPASLPPGRPLREGDARGATPAEHAAAERLIGEEAQRRDLVPVRSEVAMLRRPHQHAVRPDAIEQHLIVVLIGRRWVGAKGAPPPMEMWHAAESVP